MILLLHPFLIHFSFLCLLFSILTLLLLFLYNFLPRLFFFPSSMFLYPFSLQTSLCFFDPFLSHFSFFFLSLSLLRPSSLVLFSPFYYVRSLSFFLSNALHLPPSFSLSLPSSIFSFYHFMSSILTYFPFSPASFCLDFLYRLLIKLAFNTPKAPSIPSFYSCIPYLSFSFLLPVFAFFNMNLLQFFLYPSLLHFPL